jgi:glycosyltransferase involved in cell wall biosynthesis
VRKADRRLLSSAVPDPLVTVVIPVRDRVEHLERSVGSALEQSVTATEIIVVDDGSTDDIAGAVEAFGDRRLRYVRQDASGPAAARNRGVMAGTAPVVTFLDSDDRARPEWLACLLALLDDETCGLASVAGERRDAAGEVTIVGPAVVVPGSPVVAYLAGLFAVRRTVFDAAGGYDPVLTLGENSDLVARLVETCDRQGLGVATSHEPLVEILATSRVDRYDQSRLDAAEHLLVRDAERLRDQPAQRAQIAAIASVNAMRLGRSTQARRYALTALRAEPTRLRHYRRLAVACLGPGPGRLMTRARRRLAS